ncbi:alpha/beta-hydrolase, partial [Mycena vulgaris]
NIDAWSFLPSGPGPHPVIVIAHGLGCNKLLGLTAYAEEFSAAGYAHLVFDYRRWGTSDGTRRDSVYVSEQQDDYRMVVKYARQQPHYDPQCVVVWGSSFARLSSLNLTASMSINAYCGGPSLKIGFNCWFITFFVLGLLDLLADMLHLPPLYIPTIAAPGKFACIPKDGREGFRSVTEEPRYVSKLIRVAASVFFRAAKHLPMKTLHLIHCPILLVAGKRDVICPPAHGINHNENRMMLIMFIADHFDLFKGNPDWEQAVEAQLVFLRRHVPV